MTLCPWMPPVFFCLNDRLGGHSGSLRHKKILGHSVSSFGGPWGSNFNIPSRVSFSYPDSFQLFYYSPEGHSVSFFIRIVSSRYHCRNSPNKRTTVIRSESTLDTYLKSYSEKTVGNYDDNHIRRSTCNTGDHSKSKITPCNYGMTLE